jgi:hypothetical protein
MKDILRHLFLPHHTNNHRAKVLHIDAMFVYVLLFVFINIGIRVAHREMPQILGYATDIYADQLLSSTNTQRAASGLSQLTLNSQLSQAAALKAQDMFTNNYWAHNSPQGKTPWQFIAQAGYKYAVAGENLAKNFNNSAGVVDAWMTSPTHRDNILKSSYREVGFAVVNGVLNGEETTLVVQMFGAQSVPQQTAVKVQVPPEAAKTAVAPPAETAKLAVMQPSAAGVSKESQAVRSAVEVAPVILESPQTTSAFNGVTLKPLINLGNVTRGIAYGFIAFLLIAFIVDAYIVARRRIVRVTGHNFTHVLFFVSISIALAMTLPGSII